MSTTYELIESVTLGSAAASVTFSSIPGTFDDLLLVMSVRSNRTSATTGQAGTVAVRPNAATTGLSTRWLRGTGSAAASSTDTVWGMISNPNDSTNWTANTFSSTEMYIPNYAGSTNKSMSAVSVVENNNATAYIYTYAGLWTSTAAITSLELIDVSWGLVTGSTFHLYGIKGA